MPKDTFYFSHDYNSRTDTKVKKLLSKHGFLGYGVFWAIIEDLYNNANALPTDYDSISFDLRTDKKIVESIVNDFDLFVFDNGFFGSLSIQKRIEQRNSKSVKARESALKRWNKYANALPTDSERIKNKYKGNAIKESKVKENKEKKIAYAENIFLKSDEYEKLIVEFGELHTTQAIAFLHEYKIEKGYKTRSDYLTLKRWVFDAINKKRFNSEAKNGQISKIDAVLDVAEQLNSEIKAKYR
jgi:hypothetical protein